MAASKTRISWTVVMMLTVCATFIRAENGTASKRPSGEAESHDQSIAENASAEKNLPLPPKKQQNESSAGVLVLPKIEVTAPKTTPFDEKLKELEKEQAREERGTKLSWLEALFSGKNKSNARTEEAKARVEVMNWERMLYVALLTAKTEEEKKQIREEIRMFKSLRR